MLWCDKKRREHCGESKLGRFAEKILKRSNPLGGPIQRERTKVAQTQTESVNKILSLHRACQETGKFLFLSFPICLKYRWSKPAGIGLFCVCCVCFIVFKSLTKK